MSLITLAQLKAAMVKGQNNDAEIANAAVEAIEELSGVVKSLQSESLSTSYDEDEETLTLSSSSAVTSAAATV